MKRTIENIKSSMWIFLVGICTLLSFSGCNEDDMPFIKLDEEVIVLTTDIQKKAVDVKANVPWKATSDVAWCRVLQGSGSYKGGFELVVEPNNKPAMRTATITVSGGRCSATLLVQQPAAELTLSVSEEEVSFGMEADKHTILVVANNEWTAHSSTDWCTIEEVKDEQNNQLIISVDDNTIGKTRQATVSLVSEIEGRQVIKNIKVIQYTGEYVLELVSEKYNIDKKEQEMIVPLIISGKPYTLNVATDSEWLSAEIKDNKEIKLNVTENKTGEEREANITVTMSGISKQPIIRNLTITQSAHVNELNIAVEEINLEPEGGKMDISYSANGPIKVESSSSWFKAVVSSAENKDVIALEYEPNYTLDVREGYITAILKTQDSKEVRRTIKLIQQPTEGYKLNVLSEKYKVDKSEQDLTIPLLIKGSPFTLNAVSDSPWIKVFKSKDETKLFAEIEENISGEERSAIVTITMSDIPGDPIVRKVQIIQSAQINELSIPMDEVELNANGGEILIPFKANDVPTLQCSDRWFRASIAKQSDMIKVVYDPNHTESTREGYLTAKIKNGEGKEVIETVKLIQNPSSGYKLEVASDNYTADKQSQVLNIPLVLEGQKYTLSAASSATWAEATANKAKKMLTVKLGLNDTGKERVATITVTMSDKPGEPIVRTVKVTQAAVVNELSVSVAEANIVPAGGEITIPYTSNGPVKLTSSVSDSDDWLTVTLVETEKKFVASAKPNHTGSAREAFVTLTSTNAEGKEISCTVKITQAFEDVYMLEVQSDKFNISSNTEEVTIPLIISGDKYIITAVSDSPWLVVTEPGKQPNNIIVKPEENTTGEERIGHVTITMSGFPGQPIVRKVQVVQSAVVNEIEIPIQEANLNAKGDTIYIPFKATGKITLQCSHDWFTAEQGIDEKNNSIFIISVGPNYGQAPREGYLTAIMDNGKGKTIQRTIKLMQSNTDVKFELSNSECVLDYSNAFALITLQSDGEWYRSSKLPKWLKITPENGTGNANLEVSADNNIFGQDRIVDVVYTNKLADKSIILKVVQKGNPIGAAGFSHLGHGYNIMGVYANDQYVKPSVLDQMRLLDAGHIADPIPANSSKEETIQGKTREEYQHAYTVNAGVSAEAYGFSASVETNFSEEAVGSKENSFATFRHVTKKRIIQLKGSISSDELAKCVTDEFKADVNKLSADKLVEKYGTHVVLGFAIGGILEYSMSADSEMQSSSVDWGLAVQAGFSYCGMGGSASAGYSQYESMKSENYTFEEKLICRGGESQYSSKGKGSMETYNQWLASLEDQSKWVMVDYEENGMRPLWEFVDGAKRNEVKTAVDKFMRDRQLGQPTTSHKYFQAKITSLWSNYDDHGTHSEWKFSAGIRLNNGPTDVFLKVDDDGGLSIPERSEYPISNTRKPYSKVTQLNKTKEITIELRANQIKECDVTTDTHFNDATMKLRKPVGADYWIDEYMEMHKDGEVIKLKATKKGNADEYIEFWYVLKFEDSPGNLNN